MVNPRTRGEDLEAVASSRLRGGGSAIYHQAIAGKGHWHVARWLLSALSHLSSRPLSRPCSFGSARGQVSRLFVMMALLRRG